jgi:hypothetical protein
MKRKELYEYIREEIINELSITEKIYRERPGSDPQNKNPDLVSTNPNSSLASDSQFKSKYEPVSEMARPSIIIKIGDQAKVDRNKTRYGLDTLRGKIIDAVEKAGDQGISFNDIENSIPELGKNPKSYMEIKSLVDMGLFDPVTTPKAEPKPKKEPKPEPEDEEPVKDDWEAEEEPEKEKGEEEPKMSDIEAEKVPKSMDDEKIKAANAAAAIVKNLSAKIKAMKKKDDEYEKKMKALKQYIQNNRSILTKVGTIKNLTGDLIS